jgi:hypothetical protein
MEPMTYPDETDYQVIGVAAILVVLLVIGVVWGCLK